MNNYIKIMREKVGHDTLIMVGAGVFVYKDGKVLLQKRRDNGCWAQHGGAMEIGETLEDTAKRELKEETGLTANSLEFLGVFSGKELLYTYPNGDKVCNVAVMYVCQDYSGDLIFETNETSELKWFDINKIPKNISPSDRLYFDAFLCWCKTI